jgi:Tfp pilus assembly protein PilN
MRPINLIPLDERRGQRAHLRSGPLAYVLVGALLVAFAGVYMLVSAGNAISDRETQLASLEQQLDANQARAEALQSFTAFASLEQSRTQTVSDLARSRFDWERVMRELALVIPGDVSLTDVAGRVSAETAASSGSETGAAASASTQDIESPTLTITGCGSTHDSVARLVAALRDIDGVTRVGLQSSTRSEEEGSSGGSATGTAAPDSGGSCVEATSFELSVAFDGVAVDPATGGVVSTDPPEVSGGETGVADAKDEQAAARDSAGSAVKKGNETIDRLVPGA